MAAPRGRKHEQAERPEQQPVGRSPRCWGVEARRCKRVGEETAGVHDRAGDGGGQEGEGERKREKRRRLSRACARGT